MIEISIHGRGGRGGVTLAKLLAGAYFLRGEHVQAFGVYGAERTGAPVQAFVRVDSQPIALHGEIQTPNHVVVLDPSLVSPGVVRTADPRGWVIINAPGSPETYTDMLPGRSVAVVDATAIAVDNRLGTGAIPIVNTAMLGAILKVLGMSLEDAEAALSRAGFGGANITAAGSAFESVTTARLPGACREDAAPPAPKVMGFLDDAVGGPPVARTGSWASRYPHGRELTALCSSACPAGNDVRGFVQAAAKGDYQAALAAVLETSPFPGTCGRVCPAPCMAHCNRGDLDEPVNVRQIERGIERSAPRPPARMAEQGERVAVVGAGPAGLSAAYHLARLGHVVTLIEKDAELGGLLRTGIPAYRLPRETLDREIAYILDHGVVVETGRSVDATELTRLRREHGAVVVATGLPVPRTLALSSNGGCAVESGTAFLDAARNGGRELDGRRVVVVGGGNTAVDSARTALRLGARDVRIAYRRTRAEMPAIAEEIDDALAEGALLCELVSPDRFSTADGATELVCRRMMLADADEAGRRAVVYAGDESTVALPCDLLLLAVGQEGDLPDHLEDGDAHGTVVVCGDAATGEGTVAAAIGSGRAAALRVHRALRGVADEAPVSPGSEGNDELADLRRVDVRAFEHVPQLRGAELPIAQRRMSFAEIRRGIEATYGRDAIATEAARCFSCGSCSACGRCVAFCPEGVVRITEDGRFVADDEYCKGCGLCASVCPRGALDMREAATLEEAYA